MSAHTPGPWRYKPGDKYAHVVGGNPEIGIADCAQDRPDSPEWQANARLIAAAPQLLEALRDMKAKLEHAALRNDRQYIRDMIDACDAAIAAATGEPR